MQRLIDRGHAYAVDGDVYFDVRSFPAYGELTGQKLDDLQPAADTDTDDRKRDPRDFALWKAHKDGEPETASWDDARGAAAGRAGTWSARRWPSATSGAEFDIHGGGLDLRFPHHENEQAQSRAAGDGFARYWLHNGWVTLGGEKMSKSMGNTALVDEVVQRVRPVELRYYLARAALPVDDRVHRRRAGRGRRRLPAAGVLRPPGRRAGRARTPAAPVLCAEFTAALDDDLGTPAAVAAIHEAVRQGNTALADGDDAAVAGALGSVRAMLGVLGLDPLDPQWATGGSDEQLTQVDRRPRLAGARAAAGGAGPQGLRRGRRDPRPAHQPRRLRRGHPAGTPMGADPLMAGNSQRRGRTTGAGKKTATAGTGGKNRRSLAGRGATPPAEARPGHPAQRRAAADQRQRADRARARAARRGGPGAAARPQPGGRGAAGEDPGQRALRRHRRQPAHVRRADRRGRAARRRPRAAAARGGQGRVRPDVAGRAAPGHRPAGAAVRLRAPRRPARPRPQLGPAAADRGAGRRDRPAQPRRRRPLGRRLRRARRRRARSAGRSA